MAGQWKSHEVINCNHFSAHLVGSNSIAWPTQVEFWQLAQGMCNSFSVHVLALSCHSACKVQSGFAGPPKWQPASMPKASGIDFFFDVVRGRSLYIFFPG